ncbi:hypothetical protein GOODEAATRI_015854 [Goodea atripinnis]|uniref:Uncharacterized protein n=1 Tax=Goodea atripinnis TaxID=208336 RepID=A0ABV0PYB6_9TELE
MIGTQTLVMSQDEQMTMAGDTGALLLLAGYQVAVFRPLRAPWRVTCPASSRHQQQHKTHDKKHHRYNFSLWQVIVSVGHPCSCNPYDQRDDAKGKDAPVPRLLHTSCSLRQTLQGGENFWDFSTTSLQGQTLLTGVYLGLWLASKLSCCTAHPNCGGKPIPTESELPISGSRLEKQEINKGRTEKIT